MEIDTLLWILIGFETAGLIGIIVVYLRGRP